MKTTEKIKDFLEDICPEEWGFDFLTTTLGIGAIINFGIFISLINVTIAELYFPVCCLLVILWILFCLFYKYHNQCKESLYMIVMNFIIIGITAFVFFVFFYSHITFHFVNAKNLIFDNTVTLYSTSNIISCILTSLGLSCLFIYAIYAFHKNEPDDLLYVALFLLIAFIGNLLLYFPIIESIKTTTTIITSCPTPFWLIYRLIIKFLKR